MQRLIEDFTQVENTIFQTESVLLKPLARGLDGEETRKARLKSSLLRLI